MDERTDEQLASIRAKAVSDFADMGVDQFTCDNCPERRVCLYVFDAYNTDGDCLADK